MHDEHVFGDLRPFAQCHAPTLVRRPNGELFVAWFAGTREGHRDTAIWAAARAAPSPAAAAEPAPLHPTTARATHLAAPGKSWSEPRRIAKAADEAHWNPVLFALGASDWMLHFKVGERIRDWSTWAQRSLDAGASWEAPRPLVPGDRGGRGAVKNKPIQLRSGDWLAGASLERGRRWDAFVDRSPNGIDAWQASPLFPVDRRRLKGKGIIQPTLWQSSDDRVHALMRSTEGTIYRSDSSDAGRTWSTARPIDVPNNNSGLDLVRLRSGVLALACNPVEGNWAERSPLSVLFSGDGGESWPERIDVETGPGEFSYPALIADGDGLALAFTWNRRRIAVARIDASEIPDL